MPHALRRASRALLGLLPSRPVPLLGTVVAAEYIPPRRFTQSLLCGHAVLSFQAKSAPFLAATIQASSGELLHVNVEPGARLRVGEPVSAVARRSARGALTGVDSLLRPRARLLERL